MNQRPKQTNPRTGRYIRQPGGHTAFVPAPFPPSDVRLENRLLPLLSKADQELGKLIGAAHILPNPDLFVFMYVRREAVLSSQIEGTQASLMDILEYEAYQQIGERRIDVAEVSNYVTALRYGLERLKELPLSLRLVREIHQKLMEGVRGGEPAKTPGEFRRSQNWVGGASPATARFVPPPPHELGRCLDEFEKFLHAETYLPVLIKIGLAHAQFETIHPFLDGNGRIGRLLITFMLCEANVLSEPLLYLSIYFKENRNEYYDRLQAVRDHGDWEGWLAFFLDGVATVATQATETARKIVTLRESLREKITQQMGRRAANATNLLDHLFRHTHVNVGTVGKLIRVSQPTANSLVAELVRIGILVELTGQQRNRIFYFKEYLDLFAERDQRE